MTSLTPLESLYARWQCLTLARAAVDWLIEFEYLSTWQAMRQVSQIRMAARRAWEVNQALKHLEPESLTRELAEGLVEDAMPPLTPKPIALAILCGFSAPHHIYLRATDIVPYTESVAVYVGARWLLNHLFWETEGMSLKPEVLAMRPDAQIGATS